MKDMSHEMADGLVEGPGGTEPRGIYYGFSPAQHAWPASYPVSGYTPTAGMPSSAAQPGLSGQGAYGPGYAAPYGSFEASSVGADGYGSPYSPPAAQPAQTDANAGMAIAALVLGIISALAWLLPICGFPFAVAGIVCGVLGRRSVSKRTMATIGLVLAIAALVLTLANAALGVYLATSGTLR